MISAYVQLRHARYHSDEARPAYIAPLFPEYPAALRSQRTNQAPEASNTQPPLA